jgi:hypothetical protein
MASSDKHTITTKNCFILKDLDGKVVSANRMHNTPVIQ